MNYILFHEISYSSLTPELLNLSQNPWMLYLGPGFSFAGADKLSLYPKPKLRSCNPFIPYSFLSLIS